MESDVIVELKDVSMRFNIEKERIDSLKEYVIKLLKRQLFFEEFWALREINLKIYKGEIFGIIGSNGAGKSTLLKIIAGVLKPTTGKVSVYGSMAPLIELGAGFDPDLTARENIYLNGAILGYGKKFINEKFEEIMNFAELWDFVDVPLKNYSSGMYARLGFTIATAVKPDVLIVDEILSVGDIHFKRKCEERISNMIKNDTTVVLVSHSIKEVEELCNRVMWLENGFIRAMGNTKDICEEYKKS